MYALLSQALINKILLNIKAQSFNLDYFQYLLGVKNNEVFTDVIRFLDNNKIGRLSLKNKMISFSESDKIQMIVIAIRSGCDIQTCSQLLTWKDFEAFTSEVLIKSDYDTKVNIHLTKPRCQLDVVAVKNNFLLCIDCKHWRNYSRSAIIPYIEKQVVRTRTFLVNNKKIKKALPMLVTLYDSNFKLICGVPVVPIKSLQSFLLEFEALEEQLLFIYN